MSSLANPWSNVYGLARSLVAFATCITLVANDVLLLFKPVVHGPIHTETPLIAHFNFFGLLSENLELARWIAVVVLAVVVAGWRPRLTALPHWWITWSFMIVEVPLDGGDQIASNLSFL
jgi:antimicrobial peptide system SdpB family protein